MKFFREVTTDVYRYTVKRKHGKQHIYILGYLCTFLDRGEVEISNNQVENAIRPFVVGRKGWLFSDTPEGAEASAVIYSLMETAKANGLRLEDYILHLLSVLPERFEVDANADIDDLLPWHDGIRDSFATL